MRSPRSNQTEVASYRCDEIASRLGAMGLFRPTVLSNPGRLAESTGGADLFLLVVGVASAASATNVGGLLSLTHGRCTFGHALTRTTWPPTTPL